MIDILVTTHGRLDLTMACVDAIYANTQVSFHLIVVDDSRDLTPQYFKKLKQAHNNITFIHSYTPYKSGNQIINIALAHCKTPYLTIVNNSVRIEPDWETMALDLMAENPKLGAVGFKILYPHGLIESAGITIVNYVPLDIGRDEPSHRQTLVYECDAVMWSFVMLRKEAVGILEEDIYNGFRGWDDCDNCFVMRKFGWQIVYDGFGVGYHTPRATRGVGTPEQERRIIQENRENALIFYKRWGLIDKVKAKINTELELVK